MAGLSMLKDQLGHKVSALVSNGDQLENVDKGDGSVFATKQTKKKKKKTLETNKRRLDPLQP